MSSQERDALLVPGAVVFLNANDDTARIEQGDAGSANVDPATPLATTNRIFSRHRGYFCAGMAVLVAAAFIAILAMQRQQTPWARHPLVGKIDSTSELFRTGLEDAVQGCPACAPSDPVVPDVVIPFFERDLCKLNYTAKSLTVNDPKHRLGDVYLMWVSTQPASNYMNQINEIQDSFKKSRGVQFFDMQQEVQSTGISGWHSQQLLKLKIASEVRSPFYIVLDSKNTLIRPLDENTFFTRCNQGKIQTEYPFYEIPEPHNFWYQKSADALHVPHPSEGDWPTSITPVVLHKKTVLDMLGKLGESASIWSLCGGPLCDLFGARSMSGQGATEFTMYTLFAHSRKDFECNHKMVKTTERWAASLWKGDPVWKNEKTLHEAAYWEPQPYMFGAQYEALDDMDPKRLNQAVNDIATIYRKAKLYNPLEDLLRCVVGQKN